MFQQTMKKLMAVLMVAGLVGGLAGCNTVAGAGKDIQRGGEVVEETSHDVQHGAM
ncbi:entericidin A/B family lipoprotein [Oceanisphaera sp. IT1-181]|uniref:entericidin A/B family lipoprotein n=1 Tax=Oceanisphaera sp. IT1-181 TaxID=3081199 RepID=UPI0029C9C7DB|nr:entericidin A/B family lipoprotein [Oceanisphaera sp. IT1-181]